MDESQIEDVLKRLGFFYVQTVDNGSRVDFYVGHIQSVPFLAVNKDKNSGALAGPYAELVGRLGPVVLRYVEERNDVVGLPPFRREAWIADLAEQAQLKKNELALVVMSSGRE